MKVGAILLVLTTAVFAAALATANTRETRTSEAPAIVGTVSDGSGKPLAGVTVSARAFDRTMTTSVYTDDAGRYVFPHLDAGRYRVWMQRVTFATARDEATLDGNHTVSRDVTLKPLADYGAQLTGAEWFDSLPDDTVGHRRVKQIMYVACTGCHSLDVVLQNRFDETGWNAIVHSMEQAFYNGYRPGDLKASQLRWQGQIIRHHRAELAQYLTEVRGPESRPLTLKPFAPLTGDAARAVVTEYELPVKEQANEPSWYTGSDWSLGPSTGMHGIVGIHDVVADASGTAWITQARTTFETNRSMIKLNPDTGAMTSYRITSPDGTLLFFEQIATPDPKGYIWMHDSTNVVRLNPMTEAFSLFHLPTVMGTMVNSTDTDSKGRAYINGRSGTAVFDPAEQGRKDVAYPGWSFYQQHTPGDGTTYGITTDADDNVWWSESYVDKVAMRDAKTGQITEFDMHDPLYDARKSLATPADLAFYASIGGGTWAANSASPLPYANMPRRLSADKRGDTVWVPNWAQSNIAEINIRTHKITYHELPIRVHPYKTTVDKDHNVWTDTSLADAVWKFVPSTGQWTMYRLPSHGCGSRHISFDDRKGELWLPCDQSNKVMRFQFRTAAQVDSLRAAVRPAAR